MKKADLEMIVKKVSGMGRDELVGFLLDLRRRADASERVLLMTLVAVDQSGAWKKIALVGEETFADFLDSTHVCKPSRYANWRQVAEELDFDVIDTIGVHGSVRLAAVPAEKRELVQQRMLEAVHENSDAPLSNQAARNIVVGVCGVDQTKGEKRSAVVERLEGELRAARSELRELKFENKKLRAALEKNEKLAAKSEKKGNRSQTAPEARV
jgi:hypothetical protein